MLTNVSILENADTGLNSNKSSIVVKKEKTAFSRQLSSAPTRSTWTSQTRRCKIDSLAGRCISGSWEVRIVQLLSAMFFFIFLTTTSAAMKSLIETHKEAIKKYTNLDLPTIEKVTYLHDFDREVQYVMFQVNTAVSNSNCVSGVLLGDIPL